MNLSNLQDLVFPKYHEFFEHNGHCPNTLLVGSDLAFQLSLLMHSAKPEYAGMQIIQCPQLKPTEFKLGVLL